MSLICCRTIKAAAANASHRLLIIDNAAAAAAAAEWAPFVIGVSGVGAAAGRPPHS